MNYFPIIAYHRYLLISDFIINKNWIMKRSFIALIVIAILLVSILVPGCEKGTEYNINRGAAELKDCPITQIIRNNYGIVDTLVFVYNSFGDPVSATRLPSPGTGAPTYVFKYDKKRRLTDVIGLYHSGTSAEVWHRYFYDNPGNSKIVKDSTYYFVLIQNGQPFNYLQSSLSFLTYDKYDRIIKDSILYSWTSESFITEYSYDENGNRTGRTYDNKINIHRTNKIWMFYDRDYSVNNPFVADSYNSKALPTKLNLTPLKATYLRFLGEDFFIAQIKYGCR